ncbi:hypothetical protein E7681_04180 [Thalassobius vesicularis]|uniref:Uncharacterized protein n=2 Tax=Thalassobius vesicularis TaxID=1294297 RepID=A0A4S3MC71_9RHOB|nr:hypothetical protein E7681_04180 [Thalassobius vesicularis]
MMRPTQVYRVDGATLTRLENDAPLWQLDLSAVSSVSYAQTSVSGVTSRYLQLEAEGQTRRLSQTGAPSGPGDDFTTLITTVLRALHAARPEIQIGWGIRGRARVVMFVLGVLCLLVGIGLPVAAIASGVSSDRFAAAALPSLLLLALGVVFSWANRPWEPLPTMPLSQLIATLDTPTNDS